MIGILSLEKGGVCGLDVGCCLILDGLFFDLGLIGYKGAVIYSEFRLPFWLVRLEGFVFVLFSFLVNFGC